MILGRHDKYQGYSPHTLPLFYVCAECGGEVRCGILYGGEFSVNCRIETRHEGLKKRRRANPSAARDAYEKARQIADIAEVLPEVKAYLAEKRRADNLALFGED